jgi:hypothetical protein
MAASAPYAAARTSPVESDRNGLALLIESGTTAAQAADVMTAVLPGFEETSRSPLSLGTHKVVG